MNNVEVYPVIAPDNYPVFCGIIKDMPATYDEWFNLQSQDIRGFRQLGYTVKEIPIDSDEFIRFLRARGARANIVSLRNFTIEKKWRT